MATEPLVHIQGESQCPGPEQLEAEILQWSVRPVALEQPNWHGTIERPTPDTARLRLYAPDGTQQLERSIRSDDCVALAKAFAIILEAHFLDLGLVERREPPAPAVKPPPPPPVQPKTQKPRRARATPATPAALRAAAGLGAEWVLPEPGLTGAAQLSLGVVLDSHWSLTLGITGNLQRTQGGSAVYDRIQSQALSARGVLAHRFAVTRVNWLEPNLGVGVRVTRLHAVDIAADAEISTRPTAQLGFAAGWQGSANWSTRFDVVGQLLLDRDRYRIDPHGTVGQGPRAVLLATFGVEFTGY